jgi:hypothetical protein
MIPEHKCGIELHPKIQYFRKKQNIKTELLLAQRQRCYWCRCTLATWWTRHPTIHGKRIRVSTAEIDHIIPRCAGGSNDPSNLVVACQACNRIRGTLYMRGAKFFVIIGQETPIAILDRYKLRYSSNQFTRKKYANRTNQPDYRSGSVQREDILDCDSN